MERLNLEAITKCTEKLRADGRDLKGDGFGYIGNLKRAYQKATKALDELAETIKNKPEEPLGSGEELDQIGELIGVQRSNPECCGQGAENLPHCQCRTIMQNLNRN